MYLMYAIAPHISVTDSCSHNRVSVLHTYIFLLSAADTVLVLLVYKCAALLNTRRHTENKYPLNVSLYSYVRL